MFSFLTVPVPAFDRSVDCVLEGSNSRPATSDQNQNNFTDEGCSKWIEAKGKAGSLDANFLDYFRHRSNKKISIQPSNNNQNLEFAPALSLRPVNVRNEEVAQVAQVAASESVALRLWVMLLVTTLSVFVTSAWAPRVQAINRRKGIRVREANPCKEGNALARRY